jgi:hypothetical protein
VRMLADDNRQETSLRFTRQALLSFCSSFTFTGLVRKIDHFSDRKPHRLLSQRAAIKSSLWALCVYSVISHCKYLAQKKLTV